MVLDLGLLGFWAMFFAQNQGPGPALFGQIWDEGPNGPNCSKAQAIVGRQLVFHAIQLEAAFQAAHVRHRLVDCLQVGYFLPEGS